jgi:inhibitor of cysteine peptidase
MASLAMTEEDSGRDVSVALGDELRVSLKENPTTGYGWSVLPMRPAVLELEDSAFTLGRDAGVGGGGRRTFRFRAAAVGRAVLDLELRQPWEPGQPPEARFNLTVRVAIDP